MNVIGTFWREMTRELMHIVWLAKHGFRWHKYKLEPVAGTKEFLSNLHWWHNHCAVRQLVFNFPINSSKHILLCFTMWQQLYDDIFVWPCINPQNVCLQVWIDRYIVSFEKIWEWSHLNFADFDDIPQSQYLISLFLKLLTQYIYISVVKMPD